MDDSGSMQGNFPTALFALQSLATMIDEDDTLWVIKMSAYRHPIEINKSNLKKRLPAIRGWTAHGQTPFAALETALKVLVHRTKPGMEAILLVLTDGEFDHAPANNQRATRIFQRFQHSFKGENLRAFFVSLQNRKNAHIRHALLSTFNGHPDEGDIFISRNTDLLKSMRSIYASILGIQDDPGVINTVANTITFSPPFPVTKLVFSSFDEKGKKLPVIESYPTGNKATVEHYDYQMPTADEITPYPLQGQTIHIKPWPPIQPGKNYQITLDHLPTDKVQVLLKTSVSVDWSLFDGNGNQLQAVNGVYSVGRDTPLFVRAWLVANDAQGNPYKVKLSSLTKKLHVSLRTNDGQVTSSKTMRPMDNDSVYLTGNLLFDKAGHYRVSVAAKYPGFIDIRARDIEIDVLQPEETLLTIRSQGTALCPDCRPDNIQLSHTDKTPMQAVLEMQVSASSKRQGAVEIDVQLEKPLPVGVEIIMPDGSQLNSRNSHATLTLEQNARQPQSMTLQYNADYQQTQVVAVPILFSARIPWKGEKRLELKFIPKFQPLSFLPAGTTLGTTHDKPFPLKVDSLNAGEGLYYKLKGLVAQKIDPADVSIEKDSWRSDYVIAIENNHLLKVMPSTWWCDCFTSTGNHTFTLHYYNPVTQQQASIKGQVFIAPTPWLARCWQEWLTMFSVMIVIAKLFCFMRTHRFPPSSKVDIYRDRRRRNHGPNQSEYLHWDSWFWPFCRSEVTVIDGLRLRARKNGLELLPGDYGSLQNPQGTDLLVNIFKRNNERPIKLLWNQELSDGQTVYKFIKE